MQESSKENQGVSDLEKSQLLLQAARNKLLNFAEIRDTKYKAEWFHEIIADVLEDCLKAVTEKRKKRVILTIPPRHGKTQLASIDFPAWALGKIPTIKFILSMYGADIAEKTGSKTRDVMQSEEYHNIFPGSDSSLRQDSRAKSYWQTKKGGSYMSVGIGGPVTGTGADIILMDDPFKSREEAESVTIRNNVWEYYRSTLYSRLEGSGAFILIMQRWHTDDLVGRLIEDDERRRQAGEPTEDWEIINFPAIAEKDEYYKGVLVRKQGVPLWEDKFNLDVLANIRTTAGVYNWTSQYQQEPISADTQEFHEHWFKYYNEEDISGKYLSYYTLIDPAISQSKDADNAVVLTIAKEVDGPNIYRIREDAGHFTPKQIVNLVFLHQKEYNSEVYLETIAYQKALKYSIEEEQKIKTQYFRVNEFTSQKNKVARIRGLIPLYERGIVYHKKSDVEFEKEMLQFPGGKHDDRIDCFSFLLQVLIEKKSVGKKTKSFVPKNLSFVRRRY